MGAVTFSIDPKLIQILQSELAFDLFVETGTFEGETIRIVKNYFNHIYSIELSPEYYEKASQKFHNASNITIIQGNSADALAALIPKTQGRAVIYWLDAHWCIANDTAGQASQCPLLGELKAIQQLHEDSMIIIDDARLFLAAPPAPHEISHWPSFQSILNALNQLSQSHSLMIVNDCILFFPKKIGRLIQSFAHEHGLDWLNVLDKSRDYDALTIQLQGKEKEIQYLKKTCDEREAVLIEVSNNNTTNYFNQMLTKLTELITKDLSPPKENHQETTSPNSAVQKQEALLQQMQELVTQNCKMIEAQLEIILASNKMVANLQKISLLFGIHTSINATKKFLKKNYRRIKDQIHFYHRIKRKIKYYLAPKLGVLDLYPPKPLVIPIRYRKKSSSANLPTISIVTPAFNHGAFLERTISSVINQKYPSLEYIIQDGGSSDQTTDILQRYQSSIKHWESIKDNGQSHAINLGFRHSTGEIMAYLNSDDILLPGSLDYVGRYFANNPDIDVIYSHRILIDNDDKEIGRWILPPHNSQVLSWADYIPQETLFWRRSIWEKTGGKIDESFYFAMDWDLILRFKEANAKFMRLPRFLGAFRIHPHQKTSAQISNTGMDEMQRLRERCHNRQITPSEIGNGVRSYLYQHVIYHKLYQIGLLRY